jgi:cell division septation protein DedD
MSRRTAVVASVLLVGVPPATWLASSQRTRETQAAVVASTTAPRPASAAADASIATRAADAPPVTIDEMTSGTLALADGLTIQVAAYREADRAAAVIQQLRGAGLPAFRRTDQNAGRHLVLVGPYVTEGETEAVQRVLFMQGFRQTKVVREDAGTLLP